MQILTNEFRTDLANTFLTQLNNNAVYLFAGQTLSYLNDTVESVTNSNKDTFYDVRKEMIFGKNISNEDCALMIKNNQWNYQTVYTQYDHRVDVSNTEFYVSTLEGSDYSVFKCLSNNGGSPSLNRPVLSETTANAELYQTSDGYQWKLMYTVSDETFDKFATDDYMPVVANTEVESAAVNGAIDVVVVSENGVGYTNHANGSISATFVDGIETKLYLDSDDLKSTEGFYTNCGIYITSGPGQGELKKIVEYGFEGNNKYVLVDSAFTTTPSTISTFEISPIITISGDGTGFKGRALINSNTNVLHSVEVIDRGEGYTTGTVLIGSNNDAINSDDFVEAEIDIILPPFGGHGSNVVRELYGHYVGISKLFVADEHPTAGNDYRTIGLWENPVFDQAMITLANTSGVSNSEILIQTNTGATGTITDVDTVNNLVTLSNVTGVFDNSNVEIANTEYTVDTITDNTNIIDQRLCLDVSVISGPGFVKDEKVIQNSTFAEGYVYEFANNQLYLVETEGTFEVSAINDIVGQDTGTESIINTIQTPDIQRNTGDVLYIQNFDPVTRFSTQSETIRVVIGF